MLLITTIAITCLLCLCVVGILLWVKTPVYRVKREYVQRLFEWILLGQATENDWRVFCDYPIRHDELLEKMRTRCAELDEYHFIGDSRPPFFLDKTALSEISDMLNELQQQPEAE